ncbi:hypothetical protein [Dactylosporangium sp. NPDC005555]|uniref:hypothetical protein n=1 Tax=Dactylosporangium sp. NPDC005555 TaxID=3154889 RepID=UPI0033A2BFF5
MVLRLARTNVEAHLFIELHPCETCGETRFTPPSSVVVVGDDLASRYAGPCPRCGTGREFTFRLPEQVTLPDEAEPAFGVDGGASEIIDAGEWLWVADLIIRNTPAEPDEEMTAEQRRQALIDLRIAAAAVGEAIKFVPPGADAVPVHALWTERGRSVHDAEPGRFRKIRLEAVQRTYRELSDGFATR